MYSTLDAIPPLSEIQSWEIGGDFFSSDCSFPESPALEILVKIEITDFLPPLLRSKESQKFEGKIFSSLTKETLSHAVFQRISSTAFLVLYKLSFPTMLSSRSLFFPKEAHQPSFFAKTSSLQAIKESDALLMKESISGQKNTPVSRASFLKEATRQETNPSFKQAENISYAFSAQKQIKEQISSPPREKQEQQDKEGRRERDSFHQDSEKDDEHAKKDKEKVIKAISGANSSFLQASNPSSTIPATEGSQNLRKPFIEPPKMGVFALYYLLDKMGIYSESTSYHQYKQEIEANEAERTAAHKLMLSEMKKAMDKEKQSSRWSTAIKVFSWIGSIVSIISGAIMIATGVGAVAGAILIAGGVISVTNQIMELTGGWQKIAEILPGDDPEKKRAVVTWMQIGVAVLSLILAGAGIVFGGYAAFGQASQTAMALIGGIAMAGSGVCSIGKGIEDYNYNHRMSDSKSYEKRLTELKHFRQDLMNMVDDSPDRLLDYYESLARNLGFLEDINRAHQRAWS